MTVSTTTSRADYTGNGATTAFAVPFYFLDNSHITVLRTQVSTGIITTLALTTNYTVSGAGNPAGGTVTCLVAPTTDQKLSILRNVPFTQLNTYVPNDPFPAASHERALDQLTMEVQQLDEALDRALTLPANTPAGLISTSLPAPASNQVIGWNNSATQLQNFDAQTLASIVSSGTAYSNLFSGDGVQTAFALSNNPGSVNNLDVSISGVTQRPNIDYTWVSGTTLTFTSAPAVGTNNILVRYVNALPQNYLDVGVVFDSNVNASAAIDPLKVKYQRDGAGLTRTVDAKLKDLMPNTRDYLSGGNLPFGGFAAFSLLPTVTSNNTWYYDNTVPQSNVTFWHKVPNTVSQASGTVEGIALNFDSEISTATPGATLAEQNTLRMRTKVLSNAGKHLHYHTINIVGEFNHDVYDASRAQPNEAGAIIATYTAKGPAAGGTAQAIGVWGGDLHVAKDAGVANGSMVGLEVGVHTQVNQSYVATNAVGRVNGIEVWSGDRNYAAGTTFKAHDGIRIAGDAGWTNFIKCVNTAWTLDIVKIEGTGVSTFISEGVDMVFTAGVAQNNKSSLFLATGKTSAGALVNTHMFSSSGGEGWVGTQTNHPFLLRSNNTEKVRITSSAQAELLVGTTSASFSNTGRGNINIYGSTDAILVMKTAQDNFYIYANATDSTINNMRNGDLIFSTNNAEAARITSGKHLNLNSASSEYRVNGTKVVSSRQTGWTADTGTVKRSANATYSGTASASYVQAEMTGVMNALRDATQTLKALKDDLISHGLIGT